MQKDSKRFDWAHRRSLFLWARPVDKADPFFTAAMGIEMMHCSAAPMGVARLEKGIGSPWDFAIKEPIQRLDTHGPQLMPIVLLAILDET